MCLRVKKIRHLNHKAKIAKKKIKCYKILVWYNTGLYTPVMQHRIDIHSKELIADKMEMYSPNIPIGHGIHTFSKFKTACQYYDRLAIMRHDKLATKRRFMYGIFPAVIPKGTHYWIDKDNQYVSERIEFL